MTIKIIKITFDLMLLCSVYETEDITERKSTTVKSYKYTGHVLLNTFGKETTFCLMNLRYFPFDKHYCEIEFMHLPRFGINTSNEHYNYYEREGIVFQNDPEHTNHQVLSENGEWELVELKLDTNPRITTIGESIITYPIFIVTLELQRKPSFYVMILMLPSILVSLISVIGFLLPSESGEKVTLQLTALLSYSLVFLVIVDIIPPVGGNFPLIGNFQTIFFFFKGYFEKSSFLSIIRKDTHSPIGKHVLHMEEKCHQL